MTPEILLSKLQNLNKGDALSLSIESAVYLKLRYNIDVTVLKKKDAFYSVEFLALLIKVLAVVYNDDCNQIEVGYYLLKKHIDIDNDKDGIILIVFVHYLIVYKFFGVNELNNKAFWDAYRQLSSRRIFRKDDRFFIPEFFIMRDKLCILLKE